MKEYLFEEFERRGYIGDGGTATILTKHSNKRAKDGWRLANTMQVQGNYFILCFEREATSSG